MGCAEKGITGRVLKSVSLLNCNATCDTRINTSSEDARGSEGVGCDVVSSNEVRAGPRLWRSQACIVGGSERDAILWPIGWGMVWSKLVKMCF